MKELRGEGLGKRVKFLFSTNVGCKQKLNMTMEEGGVKKEDYTQDGTNVAPCRTCRP